MFLFCCWLPIAAATMHLMCRELIAGNGSFFSGHLMLMIGRVFVLILALIAGVVNCQYALGGLAVCIAFAWTTKKISRAGFWLMGAFYGLLSGVILLDAANAMNGPKVQPLEFPIPRMVGAFVVPVVGLILAGCLRCIKRRNRSVVLGAPESSPGVSQRIV